MEIRTLESDTRMRFLLGNNPMGEMIKIVSRECKRIEKKEGYGKQIQNKGQYIFESKSRIFFRRTTILER
jgi:chorismate-pyruvate lyase